MRRRRGFSPIEYLLLVAIILVVSAVGYSSFKSSSNFDPQQFLQASEDAAAYINIGVMENREPYSLLNPIISQKAGADAYLLFNGYAFEGGKGQYTLTIYYTQIGFTNINAMTSPLLEFIVSHIKTRAPFFTRVSSNVLVVNGATYTLNVVVS